MATRPGWPSRARRAARQRRQTSPQQALACERGLGRTLRGQKHRARGQHRQTAEGCLTGRSRVEHQVIIAAGERRNGDDQPLRFQEPFQVARSLPCQDQVQMRGTVARDDIAEARGSGNKLGEPGRRGITGDRGKTGSLRGELDQNNAFSLSKSPRERVIKFSTTRPNYRPRVINWICG